MHSIGFRPRQPFERSLPLSPVPPHAALNHATITAEKDAVSRCRNFGSSVSFGLLQSDDVTTLCSTGSQQGVDVPDTVNAVDRCCANVCRT